MPHYLLYAALAVFWLTQSSCTKCSTSKSSLQQNASANKSIPAQLAPAFSQIMDPQFRMCINYALGRGSIPASISIKDLNSVTGVVDCQKKDVLTLLGVGNLTAIKGLYVSQNKLTTIPEEIGHLKQLKWLKLMFNSLQTLPDSFSRLTGLEKLFLGANHLYKLPPHFGQLIDLKELYLWRNKLTELPADIGNLINLEKLAINQNQVKSLPGSITNLKNLTLFNMQDNPAILGAGKFDLKSIPAAFSDALQGYLIAVKNQKLVIEIK